MTRLSLLHHTVALALLASGAALSASTAWGQTAPATVKCAALNPNSGGGGSWQLCSTFDAASNSYSLQMDSEPLVAGGWVALGLSTATASMNDASVVVAYGAASDYRQTIALYPEAGNSAGLANKVASTSGGITRLSFSVPVGPYVSSAGDAHIIFARGPAGASTGNYLIHQPGRGHYAEYNFLSGVSSSDDSGEKYRSAHGIMMCFAWGLFIPLGIIAARFFKAPGDTNWFNAHRGLVMFGLILAFASWIIGLVKLANGRHPVHRALGITCMTLALAQPFIAAARPAPPQKGEEATTKRRVWAAIHQWVGRAAYVIAIINVFFGLSYYNTSKGEINTNTIAFLVCWLAVMVLAAGLEVRAAYLRHDAKSVSVPSENVSINTIKPKPKQDV